MGAASPPPSWVRRGPQHPRPREEGPEGEGELGVRSVPKWGAARTQLGVSTDPSGGREVPKGTALRTQLGGGTHPTRWQDAPHGRAARTPGEGELVPTTAQGAINYPAEWHPVGHGGEYPTWPRAPSSGGACNPLSHRQYRAEKSCARKYSRFSTANRQGATSPAFGPGPVFLAKMRAAPRVIPARPGVKKAPLRRACAWLHGASIGPSHH